MAELDTRIPLTPLGFNGQRRDGTDGLRKALTLKVLLDQQQLMPLQVQGAQMGLDRQRMEMEAAQSARAGQMQARQQVEQMLMQKDPSGQLLMRFRMDPEGAMSQLWPQKKAPMIVPAGSTVFDPDAKAPVFSAPKEPTPTSIAKLIAERDALPDGDIRRQLYDAAIAKETSHQPATTVSFGTPVAGKDPKTGQITYFRPDSTGGMVSTGIAPPDKAPEKGTEDYQRNASGKILDLLDEADKIVGSATGSYLGAVRDQVAGGIGVSTAGAQGIARLKAIEGAIMMAQPRMEGPQSDKDTMLYRQMAGQVGDPTVPSDTKKAALSTIRALNQKYAAKPEQQQDAPRSAAPQADSKTITEADLQATMRGAEARGRPMTRQEAIRLLTSKGYKFGSGATGGF